MTISGGWWNSLACVSLLMDAGRRGATIGQNEEKEAKLGQWFLKGPIEGLAFDGLQHFLCDPPQLQAFVLPLSMLLFARTKIL